MNETIRCIDFCAHAIRVACILITDLNLREEWHSCSVPVAYGWCLDALLHRIVAYIPDDPV